MSISRCRHEGRLAQNNKSLGICISTSAMQPYRRRWAELPFGWQRRLGSRRRTSSHGDPCAPSWRPDVPAAHSCCMCSWCCRDVCSARLCLIAAACLDARPRRRHRPRSASAPPPARIHVHGRRRLTLPVTPHRPQPQLPRRPAAAIQSPARLARPHRLRQLLRRLPRRHPAGQLPRQHSEPCRPRPQPLLALWLPPDPAARAITQHLRHAAHDPRKPPGLASSQAAQWLRRLDFGPRVAAPEAQERVSRARPIIEAAEKRP